MIPRLLHQEVGMRFLLSQSAVALFDEQGTMKTRQVIDAAGKLFAAKLINTVVVVAPAAVRSEWDNPDPEFGQIARWADYPCNVVRYEGKGFVHRSGAGGPRSALTWVLCSYAFLRSPTRLIDLIRAIKNRKVFLVLDESIFVKNRKAIQTKACLELRRHPAVVRCTLLNGTPHGGNLMDLWAQFNILAPEALGRMNFYQFRARYAVMGGWEQKEVVGFKNTGELTSYLRPYILRRTKDECLDLPAKTYEHLEAQLEPATWKAYEDMREELVAWLDLQPSIAPNAGVAAMRLAQITSGFLGGVVEAEGIPAPVAKELGREKLKAILEHLETVPERVVIWCRFRPELERLAEALAGIRPVFRVYGGQTPGVRDKELNGFRSEEGAVLCGQPQAGGWGLNLQAASRVIYASNDYNLVTRLQSEDRVHRGGQVDSVTITDVLATSPKGRHTVDHAIVRALRKKEDLSRWTSNQWKEALNG